MKRFVLLLALMLIGLLAVTPVWAEMDQDELVAAKDDLPTVGPVAMEQGSVRSVGTVSGACGQTTPGSTNWIQYSNPAGLYVDVDTSAAGFTSTPIYITSLGGWGSHWYTTGGTSVYSPTATGFRVYVYFMSGAITPETANSGNYGWHINWCGFENTGGGGGGGGGDDPGGRGDISFTLTWTHSGSSSSEGPDIDMYVTDPNGYKLSTSRDGYGLGPTPNGGSIDYDDRGGDGAGDGGGPERAFWPTGAADRGTYTFGVRYYSGTGTAYYTLRVYVGSTVAQTYTGTLTSKGSQIQVGTYSY